MDNLISLDQVRINKGISGTGLKIIALVAMLIDHLTAVILQHYEFDYIPDLQMFLRGIGRFSFPLFAFLLVEGYTYTKSVKKYAFNMALFAIISEIPFDLAFKHRLFYPKYQNVFFTLLLGLLCIWIIDELGYKRSLIKKYPRISFYLVAAVFMAIFAEAANLLRTDYSAYGVVTIVVMYILRADKLKAFAAGCLMLTLMNGFELPTFIMLLPVSKYNGQRGSTVNKYIFYAFYPLHLIILFLIARLMGLIPFYIS